MPSTVISANTITAVNQADAVTINDARDVYVLPGVIVGSLGDPQSGAGIHAKAFVDLHIYGTLLSGDFEAALLEANESRVLVSDTGHVSGGFGLRFFGSGAVLNNGEIEGSSYGVDGNSLRLVNNGTIISHFHGVGALANSQIVNNGAIDGVDTGLFMQGSNMVIINNGHVSASGLFDVQVGFLGTAISISASAGGSNKVVNRGDVLGAVNALSGGEGVDSVTNYGHMTGDVLLNEDNDLFVQRSGGIVLGNVRGGDGNDTAISSSGADSIFGDSGDDQLAGGAEDDVLLGGIGNDILRGGVGDDILVGEGDKDTVFGGLGDDNMRGGDANDFLQGGAGDDVIAGNGGSDVFSFGLHSDVDRIVDFRNNFDTIVIDSALGVASIADVLSHGQIIGNHVVFSFEGGDTLILTTIRNVAILSDDILIT